MNNPDIVQYIPQRPPFVMVGDVLQADVALSRTSFEITADNIFVKDNLFTEPGLVENMAQTAAAGTGYRYKQAGTVVPVGFIGAIKGLKIFSLPRVGDTIFTEVKITHTLLNVHVVEATVMLGEELVAKCEMKIFEQSS